jgi:hypothetical protein
MLGFGKIVEFGDGVNALLFYNAISGCFSNLVKKYRNLSSLVKRLQTDYRQLFED